MCDITFTGVFALNRHLDTATATLVHNIGQNRHVARDINKIAQHKNLNLEDAVALYGKYGEYFFETDAPVMLKSHVEQSCCAFPGLHCGWDYVVNWQATRSMDPIPVIKYIGQGKAIDNFAHWLLFLVDRILAPRGYVLNGMVVFNGYQTHKEHGIIRIEDNVMTLCHLVDSVDTKAGTIKIGSCILTMESEQFEKDIQQANEQVDQAIEKKKFRLLNDYTIRRNFALIRKELMKSLVLGMHVLKL
jgi:hypothetical protein